MRLTIVHPKNVNIYALLFIFFIVIVFFQGCYYGGDTLKIVNIETLSLIEKPNGSEAESILRSHEGERWFFIPQVLFLPHQDEAWLGVRIYSQSPYLNYEIISSEISFQDGEIFGSDFIEPEGNEWYSTVNGWSYQVVRIRSYSYSSLLNLESDSATVKYEISVDGRVTNKSFELEVKKVRRSGW